MSEQTFEYGAREGVPRLLNIFNRNKGPVTWNLYGRAIERNPFWVKPIQESGAEISAGGICTLSHTRQLATQHAHSTDVNYKKDSAYYAGIHV